MANGHTPHANYQRPLTWMQQILARFGNSGSTSISPVRSLRRLATSVAGDGNSPKDAQFQDCGYGYDSVARQLDVLPVDVVLCR